MKEWSDRKKWAMGLISSVLVLLVGVLISENLRNGSNGSEDPLISEYCELLTPMMVQLDRTKAAFDRWNNKNLYLESKIIKEGNEAVRELLIQKAKLVHPDLKEDARRLNTIIAGLKNSTAFGEEMNPILMNTLSLLAPKAIPFQLKPNNISGHNMSN